MRAERPEIASSHALPRTPLSIVSGIYRLIPDPLQRSGLAAGWISAYLCFTTSRHFFRYLIKLGAHDLKQPG